MIFSEMKELLHGGDYNPDQWLDRPDILSEDIRLMKLAKVNVVTLGVFSWSSLEPREGEFTLQWLEDIINNLYDNGIYTILSTPSGGKPPWMIKKYPDIMRTERNRVRNLYGDRENQCNSNEIYRNKVKLINTKLAERFAHHPGLLMWHISNEMYGQCHCEGCQRKFREWLKEKYHTLDNLNKQYWSSFWSHSYSDWEEIESPAPHGDSAIHALALDYQRFYSDLSIDFLKAEIDTVKSFHPEIPVTTNMFHLNCGINYQKLAKVLDVISWDSYPRWHLGKNKISEWDSAVEAAFQFDFCRSLKNRPFLLMESTPSTANQWDTCKLKRPGMHKLSAVQALAGGSDTVQYFQWRKCRGGYEKFHGAVVSHNGSSNTRVFQDVKEVGELLQQASDLKNTTAHSDIALIFDWDSRIALLEQRSLKNKKKDFDTILIQHYEALLKQQVSIDIISQDWDFSKYKIIVAPVLYLFKENTAKRLEEYVAQGGTLVMTYYSGLVNENDLAFLTYPPAGLQEVFGVESEEVDSLSEDEYNEVTWEGRSYRALDYCDLIKVTDGTVMAQYTKDFYQGMPALTERCYQKGRSYYIAFRSEGDFLYDFYRHIVEQHKISRIEIDCRKDVMVKVRENERHSYLFLMNFSTEERSVSLPTGYRSYQGNKPNDNMVTLKGYEFAILMKDKH